MAEITYKGIKGKYDEFRAPIAQIQINGKRLDSKKDKIKTVSEIKVELSSGYEAGCANFTMYNVFDFEKNAFDMDSIEKNVQIGDSVAIFLGYSAKLEIVFRGYVAGLRFVTEKGKGQFVEVTAMDVKGQMMANNYSKQMKGNQYSACVKEILGQDLYEPILGGAFSVDSTPELALKQDKKDLKSIDMIEESDYEFVVKAAKKFAFDFYSDGDFLYFRKPKSKTDTLVELDYGEGMMFSSMEFSLTGMVSEIEVRSSDPSKGKAFNKVVTLKGNYNTKGNAAKKLINKSRKVYIDPTIDSKNMAELRANALLEQIQYRFGSVDIETVGIPEIRPGRFIEVNGLTAGKPITCYVDTVVHTFNSEVGYTTEIKGRAKGFPK